MTEQDSEAMHHQLCDEYAASGCPKPERNWLYLQLVKSRLALHARDQEIATLNEMLAARDKRIAAADAYFPKAALEVVNAEEEIARVRQQAIEECANLADNWYARNIALAIRALAKEEAPQNE